MDEKPNYEHLDYCKAVQKLYTSNIRASKTHNKTTESTILRGFDFLRLKISV